MSASDKAYKQMHHAATPIYKPWSGGIQTPDDPKKRFAANQTEYLRTRDFNPLKVKFLKMRDSPAALRKFRIAFYAFPLCIGIVSGTSHYIRESFVIYLKY